LAFHLIRSINGASLVTPLSLIATAILSYHRRGFHITQLIETVNLLLKFLNHYKIATAATFNDPDQAVGDTIELLINWKIVDFMEEADGKSERFYYVEDEKKLELEYYKNSIIHFFIHHSLVAVSLLSGTEEIKGLNAVIADYMFLKDLFKNEFIFEEGEALYAKTVEAMEYFMDSGLLTQTGENGGYKITKLGFDRLPIWAGLAKTFIESYWIASKAISQADDGKKKATDLLKSMNYLGKRFLKLGTIDHIGALSQINFQNAMDVINKHILNSHDNHDKHSPNRSESLSSFNKKLYDLSHYH
jgi:glycerol-3-phosphate O-acyltransferase